MRPPALLVFGMLALSCMAGCSDWPVTKRYRGAGAGASSPTPGGGSSGASAVSEPSLVLPDDGTPNNDGTVTGTVLDANGNTIGEIDYFTSQGEPATDANGATFVPDVLIGVSGLEDVLDPSSAVVSSNVDVPAGELIPGASFYAQAGALTFLFTVEQADVESLGQEDGVETSSLVVGVDVTADVSSDGAGGGSASGGSGSGGGGCTPNAEESCSCPDGTQSIAQCQSDGSWGACQCSGW